MKFGQPLLALLLAGWIADALASTDRDVDAGIEAYQAGDFEEALEHFQSAQERLGDRPELNFNRGLALQAAGKTEEAREAFQRGTEADDDAVRASAHYQLGNLSFDADQWDAAIESYKDCLRALPTHENAKWNLELALLKKEQQEKEEQEQEQEQDQNEDQNQDGEQDQEEQQDGEPSEEEQQEQQSEGEEEEQEQPQQGEQEQEEEQEQPQEPQQQEAQPQEIDQADIDAALEQLDAADQFMLGQPQGRAMEVEKDW